MMAKNLLISQGGNLSKLEKQTVEQLKQEIGDTFFWRKSHKNY